MIWQDSDFGPWGILYRPLAEAALAAVVGAIVAAGALAALSWWVF